MAALGLVLLVLSGIFTLGVVLSNTDPVSASAFGVSLSNVSLGGLFLAGAIAGIIFGIGLGLLVAGSARKRHRKVETKRTIKGTRSEKEQLAVENEELRSRLATERSAAAERGGADLANRGQRTDVTNRPDTTNGADRTDRTDRTDRADVVDRSGTADRDGVSDLRHTESTHQVEQEQGRRGVFGRR